MNAPPLITVIVVNYNYGRYLGECIDSVITQTYSNIEVIVVDDGSTDNSLDVLKPYRGKLLILQQENKGVSAARNAGFVASRGEWIAFLDSDDVWRREKLQQQSTYIQDSAVGMVFCGVEYTDDSGQYLGYTHPLLASDVLPQLVTFTSPTIAGGSTAVVKRECLCNLGGFDEKLSTAADLDMWTRIAAKYEIRALTAPLVKCRRHSRSMQLNVALFENDNYRFLTKVFSDPSCARIHHLRRQSFGRFYMILAGSYFKQRNWSGAIQCAAKALSYRPQELLHLLGFPIRALRRLLTP
jgi:glycosyltransferase involved in cell wall biosynthesis